MTEKENPTSVERFTVRFPDGMRDAVAQQAKAHGRSMNAEIISMVEQSLHGIDEETGLYGDKRLVKLIYNQRELLVNQAEQMKNFTNSLKILSEHVAVITHALTKNKKPT